MSLPGFGVLAGAKPDPNPTAAWHVTDRFSRKRPLILGACGTTLPHMKHSLVPLIALVFATISAGCGVDDDDSSDSPGGGGAKCTVTPACGGEIVGDWQITGFCPDTSKVPPQLAELCDSATLDYDAPVVSGSLSFKSDMTSTQSTMAKGTGYLVLPADCLKQDSLTCAQAQQLINSSSGASPVTCTASNGGCRCALAIDESPSTMGTYTTSGSKAMLKAKDELTSDYCVKGSELTLTLSFTPGDKMYQFAGQLKLQKN
jgi:hypothetical protein